MANVGGNNNNGGRSSNGNRSGNKNSNRNRNGNRNSNGSGGRRREPEQRREPQKRSGPSPRRTYTPEEQRKINQRKRDLMERQRRTTNAAIGVLAAIVVMIAGVCVWYFGFFVPNDNYEAQMRIGIQNFNEKNYELAAEAFQKALEKKPHDSDATIALSDTFAAQKKYDESIRELKALIGLDDEDKRLYERLVTLYVKGKQDIVSANEMILSAYAKGVELENELINPAPTFDPPPGSFNETTKIAIKTIQGLTIYYSTDASIPTPSTGEPYKDKISLPNNTETTYTAVAYAQNGLMSWPAVAKYGLKIKYSVDSSAMAHLGDTAVAIMDEVGPLYFETNNKNGYYYKDDNASFFYVFSKKYFVEETTTTDGAITTSAIDPNKEPLPTDAVCVAISMKIKDYILQMKGEIKVEDFMAGIGINQYAVSDASDGLYHLVYAKDNVRYDLELKDGKTITGNMMLIART